MIRPIKYGLLTILVFFLSCSTNEYTHYQSKNNDIISDTSNVALDQLISPYRTAVSAKMDQRIGYAKTSMFNGSPESILGNFAVDVVYKCGVNLQQPFYEEMTKDNTIALINFGGLRSPINEGNISVGNIFELMPFDNTISFVKVPPNGILQMLSYLKEKNGQPISNGIVKVFDHKIELYVNDKLFAVENEDLYIITSDYLAGGGDKMTFLKQASKKYDSGVLMRDAFINHIVECDTVEIPKIEGRIQFNSGI
ncbi:5'-nucleotidase C-terminal domain-containing protein [Crocinitomix algicola]|uniref:5'-nucleotidase C-terminal domain-containing protein n=1 Tax=Crocinitomix algicola TaxID=1740263 RepID=UPI000871BBA0|nr:5'-nucleotidase C-terminal domain-containing protein [Crocinitomix algicola]